MPLGFELRHLTRGGESIPGPQLVIGDRRLDRIAQWALAADVGSSAVHQMPNSSGEALTTPWQDVSPRPASTGEVLFGGVTIMVVAASRTQLRIDGCRADPDHSEAPVEEHPRFMLTLSTLHGMLIAPMLAASTSWWTPSRRGARRTIEKDPDMNPRVSQYPKATVLDPWLRAYRRRYFTQPPEGPGWRAFTAKGATRRARRGSPSVFIRLRQRWQLAIAREEQLRLQGRIFTFGPTNSRTLRS
jgi:hypothetical protein